MLPQMSQSATLLHRALRAYQRMSDEERLLWILGVGAVLYWLFSTVRRWSRRWRSYRTRKRFEEAARRKWEGHRTGHVGARYKRWDDWLKKIGYPTRGRK